VGEVGIDDADSEERHDDHGVHNGGYKTRLPDFDSVGRHPAEDWTLSRHRLGDSSDDDGGNEVTAMDSAFVRGEAEAGILQLNMSAGVNPLRRLTVTQSVRLLLQQLQQRLVHTMDDFGHNAMVRGRLYVMQLMPDLAQSYRHGERQTLGHATDA
jgi:hypothetical protein